ncbi:KpsF/GutQ family sugar-phosphate isomerase [Terrihabitans rhizophilus]|uniref:KpsF/GutQ family sugar-phosphate isomerase n=1 Tax=Terrihabitans rhizophilus TaxID=3092662 RepID=A0ABU4RUY6_9HYPH|nr:KpsF/GutQ family sugar-phosphate isomerase [Terrihabitans sp. PJ23]MDX6806671.1 KpsF/GutQ family sugar-phosphate isomerase [Terrihabitans sp. PJ23]
MSSAVRTVSCEANGLQTLKEALDGDLGRAFEAAVLAIANGARVIVTGMGKSGHIGRKVAATFASTGTPSSFVHAAEASHGDLGMITPQDVVLALSWSGETAELKDMLHHTRRFRVPVVAMTSNPDSSLARNADIVLVLPRTVEACPHGLAPTTSTTMQLALGDALAVALLESRGFSASDFQTFHPGGKLGASLTRVRDLMHAGEAMPLVPVGTAMSEAILAISTKSFGCVGVLDADGALAGIVTDGDLRRHMSSRLLDLPIDEVMTRAPRTIDPESIASAALELMNSSKIMALFVVEDRRPLGILHVHDLLRAGVA